MTVRLILEQPCPTCDAFVNPFAGIAGIPVCDACGGAGVLVSPVNCAGCKHADTTDPWSPSHRVWCFEHDHEFDATFGCTLWTAKEGTDGR